VVYDSSAGVYVCSRCGLVVDEKPVLYYKPVAEEERWFSGNMTMLIHNKGIGFNKPYNRLDARILHREPPKSVKELLTAVRRLGEIYYGGRKCVVETAGAIVQDVFWDGEHKLFMVDDAAFIALNLAARLCKVPPVNAKRLPSGRKFLSVLYELVKRYPKLAKYYRPPETRGEVLRYAELAVRRLKLSVDREVFMKTLSEIVDRLPASGSSPKILAGVAVYATAVKLGLDVTKKSVADALGTLDGNLRYAYKRLVVKNGIKLIP
jgi:transcription initiation factor TFIIIB Brf1 subunit/transcription initiation factor TFIIB